MPDVIESPASLVFRGHPGQWIAHSLFGLILACVPIGLPLTWLVRAMARLAAKSRLATIARIGVRTTSVDNARSWRVEAWSVWVGAVSHVGFDLFTHEHSKLLWPWLDEDPAWFGAAWTSTWFRVSPPGYAD